MNQILTAASNSQSEYNDSGDRLAAQAVAIFIAGNPIKKLRAWVRDRSEPFSLTDAAKALNIDDTILNRRDIRTRIGTILIQDIGCTRFQRRLSAARFWYLPPADTTIQNDDDQESIPF